MRRLAGRSSTSTRSIVSSACSASGCGLQPPSLLLSVCFMASTLRPCCRVSVLWPAHFILAVVSLMVSTLHPCCHMSVLWPAPFIPAVACLSYGLDPSSLLLSVLWPESLLSSACLMARVRHLCCCLFVLWPGAFNPAVVCLMASTLHPRCHLPALGPASFISDNYRLSCGLNPHPPTHPKCQSAVLSSIPNPWCCLSRVCNHHPQPSSTHNDVLRLQPSSPMWSVLRKVSNPRCPLSFMSETLISSVFWPSAFIPCVSVQSSYTYLISDFEFHHKCSLTSQFHRHHSDVSKTASFQLLVGRLSNSLISISLSHIHHRLLFAGK